MKKVQLLLLCSVFSIAAMNVRGQEKQQTKIDLSGNWRFSRDEAKKGLAEKWYDRNLKTVGSGPSLIALPGTTDEAKAGIPNTEKATLNGLYRTNIYTGAAWYQRDIEIPESWKGKQATLFLERNHWVTHAWLDGHDLGTHDNLISPQIYSLSSVITPGKHRLTICVDNTLKLDLGPFVSIYYEGTQTNWNGIIGAIELRMADPVNVSEVEIFPDIKNKLIRLETHIHNSTGLVIKTNIMFSVKDATGSLIAAPVSQLVSATAGESVFRSEVPMGKHPKLWDEFSPNLYVLRTSLATKTRNFHSEKSTSFGMRKFGIKGTQFTMNGRPLMLRGTLECGVFPLTGYPPTDLASWRRIYRIEKSYGLNFIRFHSWVPPEAAFTAADQEGIMIQVEGPQANIQAGVVKERDAFMQQELLGTVHTYGNHPSFCLMTIGNEYGGTDKVLTHWIDTLIKSDPRHFYASASSGQMTTNRQWTEIHWGRGVHGPNTMSDAQEAMTRQDELLPTIGHEIGQWTFFPNFNEIKKYTGVLKARNFELIADSLRSRGRLADAGSYFHSTGKQAVMLYKEEIENLLRTPGYAGFSLLDLHDYPGQGTALIGLLDPFWDSKGFIRPEEHKLYCGPTVPLLRIPKRTYASKEIFSAKAELVHAGPVDLTGALPEWKITDQNGKVIASGSFASLTLPTGKLSELGTISASLSKIVGPGRLKVTVSLKNTTISNSWDIWVYPEPGQVTVPGNITISHHWDQATRTALAEGRRVVLFPAIDSARCLQGSFLPLFWSPIWFQAIPNTMGIVCDPESPLFSGFPTDNYSTWQWWKLIQGSQTMILDNTPAGFRPLVQVIDNFARNSKLGNVFEARVGKGSLLVCTLNLRDGTLPETSAFLKSLYRYAGSNVFKPVWTLEIAALDKILSPFLKTP